MTKYHILYFSTIPYIIQCYSLLIHINCYFIIFILYPIYNKILLVNFTTILSCTNVKGCIKEPTNITQKFQFSDVCREACLSIYLSTYLVTLHVFFSAGKRKSEYWWAISTATGCLHGSGSLTLNTVIKLLILMHV